MPTTPAAVADQPSAAAMAEPQDATPAARSVEASAPLPAAVTEAAQPPRPAPADSGMSGGPPADARADELGSEHLARRQDQPEPDGVTRVIVSRVESGRFDLLYFHFKNGQVWRQIEARRFRYPKNQEFEVQISQGMLGDYQLRLDEDSPMTRIRRIQ